MTDRFGTHVGFESLAIFGTGIAVIFFVKKLTFLEFRIARINDNVILKIDDFFHAGRLHVQKGSKPARHRLEEPDVNHWCCKLNVTHPLAANTGVGDFHTTPIANHTFVLHTTELAAGAFPILLRPKNLFAEKTIFFGTIGAVIDSLRFFDFTK